MKKAVCLMFVLAVGLAGITWAKDKTVVFTWEKTAIEEDLAGFRIYEYDAQDVATGKVIDIPYTPGETEFNSTQVLDFPDGQTTTRRYRITAYDFSMNESQKSLPTEDLNVDFEAPGGCLNFKVRII
jgi:hypothetical protein